MSQAIDSFASHADQSLVNYLDFCSACERAEALSRVIDNEGGSAMSRSSGEDRFVYGSGYDGVTSRSRDFGDTRGSNSAWDDDGGRIRGSMSGRPPLSRGNTGRNNILSRSTTGSLSPPRISASQVGSRQWGSSTPLSQKGKPLMLVDSWACSVCLYTENPLNNAKCLVCDSSDYSKKPRGNSDSGCKNCRFANEFNARECGMCGMPL